MYFILGSYKPYIMIALKKTPECVARLGPPEGLTVTRSIPPVRYPVQ